MRIPAWRAFLLGGLVARAVYFTLPDTERTAAPARPSTTQELSDRFGFRRPHP